MKTITAYQAEDGKVFADREDCISHDTVLAFDEWYVDHRIYGNYQGSTVDLAEIKTWLKDNATEVKAFLNYSR